MPKHLDTVEIEEKKDHVNFKLDPVTIYNNKKPNEKKNQHPEFNDFGKKTIK